MAFSHSQGESSDSSFNMDLEFLKLEMLLSFIISNVA